MSSMVVSTGKAVIAGRMIGGASPSQAEPKYLGWGTGASAISAANTDLATPAPEARVACASSTVTITQNNDTSQWVGTQTATATRTITNVGLFDAAGTGSPPAGGTLFAGFDGLSVLVNNGDTVQITARVQYP